MQLDLSSGSKPKSLKQRVVSAGAWAVVAHFASLTLRLASTLILSRIFEPGIFGLLALITSVQMVITLLTDIGLRQAVVQSRSANVKAFVNTAWTLQIIRGFFIWFVAAAIALVMQIAANHQMFPPGSVYEAPNIAVYIAAAASSAVLYGCTSMKGIIASRNLDLRRISIFDISAQAAGLVFVVIAGLLTHSVWSFVIGQLASAAVTMFLSHFALPGDADRLGWDRRYFKELLMFGRWTFLSSSLSAFSNNADRLMLASWVSPQVLGYYSIASNLSTLADGLVGRVFGNVVFPALSEAAREKPERVPELLHRFRWITDTALLFAAGALFSSGETLVAILYDPRYLAAGWMLKYLSFGLVLSRYALAQNAYLALGRPDYLTLLSVVKVITLFSLVPICFYKFGVEGAVLAIALHQGPMVLCTFWLNRHYKLNNIWVELGVLAGWVGGWLAGLFAVYLVSLFR